MTGKECAEALSVMINCNDKANLNEFLFYLQHDHKLLQTGEIRFLCTAMKMFSEVSTDARNEYAVNAAKKITAAMEDQFGPISPKY